MSEQTETDLSYISTQDLKDELFRRNNDIILITENKKKDNIWNINAKTGKGCIAKDDISYDPLVVTDMLTAAMAELMLTHFEDEMDDPNEAQDI
jgi:hypothetical protein